MTARDSSSFLKSLKDHVERLEKSGDLPPDAQALLLHVANGYCEELVQGSRLEELMVVALKAVVCGGFCACALQTSTGKDASQRIKKTDQSPVTVADITVQAVLVQCLLYCANGKSVRIIAEERLDEIPPPLLDAVVHQLNRLLPLPLFRNILFFQCRDRKPWNADTAANDSWTVAELLQAHSDTRMVSALHSDSSRHLRDSSDSWTNAYFIVDPIDGTKGFIRQAQFSVALGILDSGSGKAIGSVIACPNLNRFDVDPQLHGRNASFGQLFFAVRNEGAKCVTFKSFKKKQTLKLDTQHQTSSRPLIFLTSAEPSHSEKPDAVMRAIMASYHQETRYDPILLPLDSMAKYCVLAQGHGDIFLRFPERQYREKVWDILPGALILKEAQGWLSHANGSEVETQRPGDVTLSDTSGLVGTSYGGRAFHQLVLHAVQRTRHTD